MTTSRKPVFKWFRSMFALLLPAFAASLICLLASPDVLCADKGDEFLISLPTDKQTGRTSSAGTSGKAAQTNSLFRAEDRLSGVVYDLRRSANGGASSVGRLSKNVVQTSNVGGLLAILKSFVLGKWSYTPDAKGLPVYKDLSSYYRYPGTWYRSVFYHGEKLDSTEYLRVFEDDNASVSGWVAVYSGYVVAPFTGLFRFVGIGDDTLVVRFNRQLVLDYGYYSSSLGKEISGPQDCLETAAQNQGRRILLPEKGLYSDKLETYFPDVYGARGVAKGLPIPVRKGDIYPIEILFSDIGGGSFSMALFIERLSSSGKPLREAPEKLPLFRTNSDLPEHPEDAYHPDFDENSPIWKVVDASGKPVPSRNPAAASTGKTVSEPKKKDSETSAKPASETSASKQEKQASSQQENDSEPEKTVKTAKRGNVITETVVERNGDTTIETVTTTKVTGNTEDQIVVVTETKNGVLVKKSATKRTRTVSEPSAETDPDASGGSETANAESASAPNPASSSEKKTDPPAKEEKNSPFGYTRLPAEDE